MTNRIFLAIETIAAGGVDGRDNPRIKSGDGHDAPKADSENNSYRDKSHKAIA